MKEEKWQAYLEEVLSFVRFRYDHRALRRELNEHMEDLYEELLADGFAADAAAEAVLQCMGDAEEIGRALDKEHGAVLGWIWRTLRAVLIVLLLFNIIPLLSFCTAFFSNLFAEYEAREDRALIWQMELDKEYQMYDDTLLLEDIYYYENGLLELSYRTKRSPFARSIDWSMSLSLQAFDADGEEIRTCGGGWSDGGYITIGAQHLDEVPPDVKTVEIHTGNFVFSVDLDTGEVTKYET